MECVLSRTSTDQDVLAAFTIIPGSGTGCGPSYLRGDERNAVFQEIDQYGSVDRYTATCSKDLMRTGDPKPSIIHSSNVLHVAKSTHLKSKYIHTDPIAALDIMKCTMHANEIHDIGQNPFYIDYWTNEQLHAYKKVCRLYGGSVCVDSTGLKMQPIKRVHTNVERSIFMYIIR